MFLLATYIYLDKAVPDTKLKVGKLRIRLLGYSVKYYNKETVSVWMEKRSFY
jgi:hypothetical protein